MIQLVARSFPGLRESPILSRRLLGGHQQLYAKAVDEWNAIQTRWRRISWENAPAGLNLLPTGVSRLLDEPIVGLDLSEPQGLLASAVAQVVAELNARGISWMPTLVAGEDDFFTYDRATTINLPWYLFTPALWWLVNERHYRYGLDEVVRILRHEVAHALGYAFELWRRADWRSTFGDFEQPYRQAYTPDPRSTDHVKHLHRSGAHQNSHYAQKHPDEDWAETFATWLAPGEAWRSEYQLGTGAREKLEYVDRLVNEDGALAGRPPNLARGRVEDWRSLQGTVREFLGLDVSSAWSDHSALARREPEVLGSVVLHELYFEQLAVRPAAAPPDPFAALAAAAFGSPASWVADVRALGMAADGWVLTTWDPRLGLLRNALVQGHADGVPPGARVLLALDLHEHAYAADYGNRKDLYLGGLLLHLDWEVIARRGVAAGLWGAPG